MPHQKIAETYNWSPHTPGPWTVGEHGSGANEADARLIAAAPDLYGVLVGILAIPGVRDLVGRHIFGSLIFVADEAIAKVEGR